MAVIWQINGQTPAALGLSKLVLTYASLAPDTLTFAHDGAAWDADPLFAPGATITLTRDGVTVFAGKVRKTPRFLGAQAESVTYEVAGPWDWLERRALLQNQAVVVDPDVSDVPTLLPQGLVILGQSDAGTTVNLGDALAAVLAGATAAGLSVEIGEGFDYPVVWDEVADLTIADAVIRLLATAPDAVSWIDYTTPSPTLHIARRAHLDAATIKVAPPGEGWDSEDYTPLESVQVVERPDLVPPGVTIFYRRIDTINGRPYLRLFTDAYPEDTDPTAENAIVRTIELAGASYTATVLEQDVVVAPLSSHLTAAGTITAASNAAAFTALSKFWKRKVGWLNNAGVTILAFRATGRALTADAGAVDGEGSPLPPETLDTSLNNELIEGFITPWMEDSALNRKGQDQTFSAEVAADVTVDGVTTRRIEKLTAGVMATNCVTKTYRWTESADVVDPEPTPEGVAQAIYEALSVMPVEGACVHVEDECSLTIGPGQVLNLTGGRESWETMRALIQSASADIDMGRTEIIYGPPKQLGPDDLVDMMRANRLKKPAERGLVRATGYTP